MKAFKNLYAVEYASTFGVDGVSVQPTKANTAKQAKERFKKRYPKKRAYSVSKIDADHPHFNQLKSFAI